MGSIIGPGMTFHDPAGGRMSGYILNPLPEFEDIGPKLFQRSKIFGAGF